MDGLVARRVVVREVQPVTFLGEGRVVHGRDVGPEHFLARCPVTWGVGQLGVAPLPQDFGKVRVKLHPARSPVQPEEWVAVWLPTNHFRLGEERALLADHWGLPRLLLEEKDGRL